MKTEVRRSNNTLTIITTCNNDYRMHDGYRDMARAYHLVRSAQALEDVTMEGARYLNTETICQMYFDSVTAKSNSVVLCTVFTMKWADGT